MLGEEGGETPWFPLASLVLFYSVLSLISQQSPEEWTL